MALSVAVAGKAGSSLSTAKVKSELIRLIGEGKTVGDALKVVGRSRTTYETYRREDPSFKHAIDRVRLEADEEFQAADRVVPDFPEFCETYLGQRLFPHQLQWFDLLEGREPRLLHESMTYEPGRESRIIVNTPPGHAKSTTITVNYVIWRIIKNPAIKVIIVSKAQKLAEQFLLQIKERLTSPDYQRLQDDFAPPGGWAGDSAGWSATRMYVSSKVRGAEAKDPTVQAIGMRGQVYGSRSDLIIVDDAVDNTNVHDYEKQIPWLLSIVGSRLAPRSGRLLVVGTRIAARDLYSELRNPERYYGGKQPWTYLLQPAVLEYADDPQDWRTLWPYADSPADPDEVPDGSGLYRRWDGETLAEVRDALPPSEWSRVYQQEQVAEDNVFKPEWVNGACSMYAAGTLPDDPKTGRPGGMNGLRIIAGLDPAVAGYEAAVCVGLDPYSGERWVLDVSNRANTPPDQTRALIKEWTDRYGIHEWRIEKNAFQGFLTQDREVREYLASRGVTLTDHHTGGNKHDSEFGVAAMSHLFEMGLIHLPRPHNEAVKALVSQLIAWQPKLPRGSKTDTVMALWFAELRCQELIASAAGGTHTRSIFQTRFDRASQRAVSWDEYESDQRLTAAGGSWWR